MRLGKHEVEVDCHMVSVNPNTGTWTARIWFVWEEDGEPQRIAGNIYFTDKAIRIARKSLKAMGFDPDTQKVGDLDINQTLLKGNRCEIEISEETYNDETSIKVKWINAIRNKEEDAKEGARVDNLLRAAGSKESKAKANSKTSTPPPADQDPFDQPPPLTDADAPPPRSYNDATPGDDIPF